MRVADRSSTDAARLTVEVVGYRTTGRI